LKIDHSSEYTIHEEAKNKLSTMIDEIVYNKLEEDFDKYLND